MGVGFCAMVGVQVSPPVLTDIGVICRRRALTRRKPSNEMAIDAFSNSGKSQLQSITLANIVLLVVASKVYSLSVNYISIIIVIAHSTTYFQARTCISSSEL